MKQPEKLLAEKKGNQRRFYLYPGYAYKYTRNHVCVPGESFMVRTLSHTHFYRPTLSVYLF